MFLEFFFNCVVSSIIMEMDFRHKYLGTGDVNGVIKIWDIEQYILQSDLVNIENTPPRS